MGLSNITGCVRMRGYLLLAGLALPSLQSVHRAASLSNASRCKSDRRNFVAATPETLLETVRNRSALPPSSPLAIRFAPLFTASVINPGCSVKGSRNNINHDIRQ